MDFSSLWFWGLARELGSFLSGSRMVGGRAFPAGLVLTVEQESDWDLFFSLDPRFPRVECLPSRGRTRLTAGWQVLSGAQVERVSQPHADRRLNLILSAEAGPLEVEYFAFPKPAVVLKQAETVIKIVGGKPPAEKAPARPFLLEALAGERPSELRAVRGLDRYWQLAAERSGQPWEFVVSTAQRLAMEPLRAWVVRREEAEGVTLVDFSRELPEFTFEAAESLSAASSRFVSECRKLDSIRGEREAAVEAALEALSRLGRTLGELKKDRARQEEHQRIQEDADLLLTRLTSVKKGQRELVVEAQAGERRLTLDPRLRPQEQAERWYQEARRLRRGMEATQSRIERLSSEADRLEALLNRVAGKLESEDADAAAAFAELGQRVTRRQPAIRVKQEPVRFRRFKSPGGLAIWVGRNNKENDELTLHAAHKEDLWFHAQQCPGSHVVLRSHALRDHPAQTDVHAAAATAAYYSRARTSKKVPVIYTLAKYVRKPRKAPAGTVTVEREKSILVEPGLCPVWEE